jgi:imidazolonepropionase-like amidohydrolase
MTSSRRTAFVGGSVFDGRSNALRPNTTVVVEGAQIVAVGQATDLGDDVDVVDVSGKTVMPGIIDCHVHLAAHFQWLIANQSQSMMYLAARTVAAMRKSLEAGITSMRDLGGLEAGFVRAQEQGLLVGPRLQTSVCILQPTNGVIDNIPGMGGVTSAQGLSTSIPGMPVGYVNSPWEARQKVREVLRAGADVIKLASTSSSYKGQMLWSAPAFTAEEIEAIVDEAHGAGVMVVCHAMGGPGVLRAVKAGVDSIEHGNHLDDETVAEMAKRGTWLVPMFWIMDYHARNDPTDFARNQAADDLTATGDSFRRAKAAGVRIAMGSDSGEHGIGGSLREIELMVKAGMSTAEALRACTGVAAECLRAADTLGTLEPGKAADLLVLDGDPLRDVSILQRAEQRLLVLQAGQPVGGAWFTGREASLLAAPKTPALVAVGA